MDGVAQLNPKRDLERFFTFMYGDQNGYQYIATKDPVSERFEQYFFQYPEQVNEAVEHVIRETGSKEVYFGPVIYSRPESTKESFRGTQFIWAEFDGNAPREGINGVPTPSIKVQSSVSGNEHWYWRLDRVESDISVLEDIMQRLTYTANADLSGWDITQILRPPNTVHHESARRTTILRWAETPMGLSLFADLPEIPIKLTKADDIKSIPDPLRVISQYTFSDEMYTLFRAVGPDFQGEDNNRIERGQRSSALTKMGHYCIEVGMDNRETLAILLQVDNRWGKFKKRKDQKERLIGIINYCRSKHQVDIVAKESQEPKIKIYSYDEFMATEVKVDWVVPGLVHNEGFVVVHGPPGSGKTQLSLRFAERFAKGEKFLKWEVPRPLKTITFSLEMSHPELKVFLEAMEISNNPLLRDNFLLTSEGEAIKLLTPEGQASVIKIIEQFEPDGIIIDSLGATVSNDSTSETLMYNLINFVNGIRKHYKIFVWFIAHPRKDQIGNKKPINLSDIYGSYIIGQHLTTGISLWSPPPGNELEIKCSKLRLAEAFKPFKARRTSQLDFTIIEGQRNLTGTNLLGESIDSTDIGDLGGSI